MAVSKLGMSFLFRDPFTLTTNMPGAEWPTSVHDSPTKKPVGASAGGGTSSLSPHTLQPSPEPPAGPGRRQAQGEGFPAQKEPRPHRPRSLSGSIQSHLFSGDGCLRKPLEPHKMTSICPDTAVTVFHSNRPLPQLCTSQIKLCPTVMACRCSLTSSGSENNGASDSGWHLRAGDKWGVSTDTGMQGELGIRFWNEKSPFPMEGGSYYPSIGLSKGRQRYRADSPT